MAAMEMRMQYDPHNTFPSLQRMQTAPIPASAAASLAAHPAQQGGRWPSSHNIAKTKTQSANMSQHGVNGSLANSQAHTSSNYSMQSAGGTLSGQSSRSSDTTQGTATSTLFPPPLPPMGTMPGQPKEGEVTATDNIMNTVADASSSLFQICVTLRQRLSAVPEIEEDLRIVEDEADDDADPVSLLWRVLQKGYPLMVLYNTLRPDQPIAEPAGNMKEEKRAKAMTFKFLQACIKDLKFQQEDCFILSDLFNDNTTGFSKVSKVVNRVLDILVQRGLIEDRRPTASDFEQAEKGMKRTQRQHIISELVSTERTYVQHLELLQSFRNLVEERGTVLGDAVHAIFFNLNHLLDFQRRFLIRVEQTNQLPESEQNWGKLFVIYQSGFGVYEQYIANQRLCEKTVMAQFDNLVAATQGANVSLEMKQMVESPSHLYGFLMKPFQRLSKYPLLLDDLYKKGDLDDERKIDLEYGRDATMSILASTNAAVDREEKSEAMKELEHRVEDWKGHKMSMFGALLLYGTFTVLKGENLGGDGKGKEGERVYHVYLFETILLCCKDIDASKPKNKLSNKQLVDKRGKPKLQLKGRIFMSNITDLISAAKPGSYTCQIFWTGDPSIENFIIRFTTEEMMKKWAQQIEAQRRKYRDRSSARGSDGSRSLGTSTTEFEFMRNLPQTDLQNPYAEYQEDEEEDDDAETLVGSGVPSGVGVAMGGGVKDLEYESRNSSFTSLRSRGESISSAMNRPGQPSSRYPQGHQPSLSLRTRDVIAQSPESIPPESYFSPIDGSPSTINSSRTSASSGMYGAFPQSLSQQLRGANGTPVGFYESEGLYQPNASRFTAPAVARQREPSVVSITGQQPAPAVSGPQGRAAPPRPGMGGMHSSTQMPGYPRNRSASSPDIHNQPRPATAHTLGAVLQGQPPVPDMPAPYQINAALIPRSQTNSPSLANGVAVPSRGQNVSPQASRERGSRGNYPTQPQPQHLSGGFVGRAITPTMPGQTLSPPPQSALPAPPPLQQTQSRPISFENQPAPTSQLKVKVHCPQASQTLTLVVPLNITYQTLKDRIDAKLQRSTSLTLTERTGGRASASAGAAASAAASAAKEEQQVVKLKYDDDGDYVTIQNDEDVQTAFETWQGNGGGMAEVELFCQR